jgi:hypothetical protein
MLLDSLKLLVNQIESLIPTYPYKAVIPTLASIRLITMT